TSTVPSAAVSGGLDRWRWPPSPPFFDYYRHKNRLLCNDSCWNRLWDEILLLARDAVVKRPTVHGWQLFSKVTMSRRVGGSPLESSGMPGIMLHSAPSRENAEQEIEQENQLSRTENNGCNDDEDIHRLVRHKDHILRW